MIKRRVQKIKSSGKYPFRARMWKYKGPAGWCFVTIPIQLSKKIREANGSSEEGWGRLKASVTIGDSTWNTAIWFDTKAKAYFLPIKAAVRKKENLEVKMMVSGVIEIEQDPWDL